MARADVATDLAAITKAAPSCDRTRAHCFGIQLHVTANEQGLVVTGVWIVEQLAQAQRLFAGLDVDVQLVGSDVLPAATEDLVTRRDRDKLADGRLGGRVIHVFLVGQLDDVDVKGAIAYGVTWRRADRKFIIVSNQARPRTLAHELGHFFGLPHSTYPISIMNKTSRTDPPPDQRRFADEEIAAMRPTLKRLIGDKIIAHIPPTP